jgi:hypothetical protein
MIHINKFKNYSKNDKKEHFSSKKAGINVCRFNKKELSLNLIFVTK